MNGRHDATQVILQFLSNPAWSGVSSICALIGIPLAIILSPRSSTPHPQAQPVLRKKIGVNTMLEFNLSNFLKYIK